MLSSHSISFTLLSRLMRGILRFIFFIYRHFFYGFICSLGLLLPNPTILLAVKVSVYQNSELLLRHLEMSTKQSLCCWHFPCETPTFLCARQVFIGKMFLTFYFRTCSDTRIICVYDVMFFSLRFNILPPENYLFFREMVIRYIKM